jgi:hypothetical protein
VKPPNELASAIKQIPYKTRHVVASIVAYNFAPNHCRDDIHWQSIWAMSRDHEPSYEWPSADEIRQNLIALGIYIGKVEKIVAKYDSYGDVETISPKSSWNHRSVVQVKRDFEYDYPYSIEAEPWDQ